MDPLIPTYARLPVAFTHGKGAWLYDSDSQAYLDALAGIAVCNLGHAHPEIAEALADQARKLLHVSNLYHIPIQERLAERLCATTGMEAAFFCNSGAEANEAAIKIARRYGHDRGLTEPAVVVADGAFHGRTLGALAATGNPKVREGFAPLPGGFVRVPYGDAAAAAAAGDRAEIAAVLVEPIQGEGGVVVPPAGWLRELRALCDQRGWLLMLDEIQTGIGRTGKLLACHHDGVTPDVLTLAKGLGNGVPIGTCLVRGPAAGVLGPGSHGTTFGGNPLAARAALTVLDIVERDGVADRAARLGERMMDRLHTELDGTVGAHPGVAEIRGRGLMIGIELTVDAAPLVRQALQQGLLINVTAGNVVRLLPPLILTDGEADRIAVEVAALIRHHLAAASV